MNSNLKNSFKKGGIIMAKVLKGRFDISRFKKEFAAAIKKNEDAGEIVCDKPDIRYKAASGETLEGIAKTLFAKKGVAYSSLDENVKLFLEKNSKYSDTPDLNGKDILFPFYFAYYHGGKNLGDDVYKALKTASESWDELLGSGLDYHTVTTMSNGVAGMLVINPTKKHWKHWLDKSEKK